MHKDDGKGRSLLRLEFFSNSSPTATVPVTTPHYFALHKSYSVVVSAVHILKLLIS